MVVKYLENVGLNKVPIREWRNFDLAIASMRADRSTQTSLPHRGIRAERFPVPEPSSSTLELGQETCKHKSSAQRDLRGVSASQVAAQDEAARNQPHVKAELRA
jgi:hypothetical protein